MGRLSSKRLSLFAMLVLVVLAAPGTAAAAGPGGWDHLGNGGTPGTDSLNGPVFVLEETPGTLYVGGGFTDAGGKANADRIARWSGTAWSALSSATSQITNGGVNAIAVSGGKVYAGGTFQNAGGNAYADYLAVWDGATWAPFCTASGPAFTGNVAALEIIGTKLYVGGSFQDGANIASADYLLACDLATGAATSTIVDATHPFAGSIYALAADSNGTLYAGGGFTDLEDLDAADNVAYRDGTGWHAMGSGAGSCSCAVTTFVRSLTANGTDVYVGTDATDVAGIAEADNVAKWNGSDWSAMGTNTAGTNGWFPASTLIHGLTAFGTDVFATGSFLDADGKTRADNVAYFDGTDWHAIGSNGAGNGPWLGNGLALAVFDWHRLDGVPVRLYAGGNFTSAGGDGQAHSVASFPLSQLVPDTTRPTTSIRNTKIEQARRRVTFKFVSNEAGSTFLCKLDSGAYRSCASPKTYRSLRRGRHEFRVKARDRAGNVDLTPAIKSFRITG